MTVIDWASLRHAYGPATDVPHLLADARVASASEDYRAEPWFSLWSALYHQDDIYPASYAAVPELLSIAETRGDAAAWRLAQRVASMWMAKLRMQFPVYHFRVYASRFDAPIIHFHRIRDTESVWIDDDAAAGQIASGDLVVLDSRVIAVSERQANEQ